MEKIVMVFSINITIIITITANQIFTFFLYLLQGRGGCRKNSNGFIVLCIIDSIAIIIIIIIIVVFLSFLSLSLILL